MGAAFSKLCGKRPPLDFSPACRLSHDLNLRNSRSSHLSSCEEAAKPADFVGAIWTSVSLRPISATDPGCVKTPCRFYDSLVILGEGDRWGASLRRQIVGNGRCCPECLDDFIDESNPVRVIDVFVDALDLAEMSFEGGGDRSALVPPPWFSLSFTFTAT
jgi:hypothetical protein